MSRLLNWSVAYPPASATISRARAIIRGIRPGVMPSGLSRSSTWAPKARMVSAFSSANASDETILSG